MLHFEQEMSLIATYVEYSVPIWWHYLRRWGLARDSASEVYDLGGYTWSHWFLILFFLADLMHVANFTLLGHTLIPQSSLAQIHRLSNCGLRSLKLWGKEIFLFQVVPSGILITAM